MMYSSHWWCLNLGKGQVGAVSYNSSAPPSARLADISFFQLKPVLCDSARTDLRPVAAQHSRSHLRPRVFQVPASIEKGMSARRADGGAEEFS